MLCPLCIFWSDVRGVTVRLDLCELLFKEKHFLAKHLQNVFNYALILLK